MPPIEFRFSLADQWSRHLFVALLRRYGIRPYRYRGQRHTTVMARLSEAFANETLWPEFRELQSTLVANFDALTNRVIEQASRCNPARPRKHLRRRRPWRPRSIRDRCCKRRSLAVALGLDSSYAGPYGAAVGSRLKALVD